MPTILLTSPPTCTRSHPPPNPANLPQVFVSDKTRAKALAAALPGGEPPNRVKKQLLAEVGG